MKLIAETAWHHEGNFSFMKNLVREIITKANADKSIPNKIGKTNLKGLRKGSKYLKEFETIGLLKLN